MAQLKLSLSLSGEILAHELMRFALNEIERMRSEDPFGFTGEDAAELARAALAEVERLERSP